MFSNQRLNYYNPDMPDGLIHHRYLKQWGSTVAVIVEDSGEYVPAKYPPMKVDRDTIVWFVNVAVPKMEAGKVTKICKSCGQEFDTCTNAKKCDPCRERNRLSHAKSRERKKLAYQSQ